MVFKHLTLWFFFVVVVKDAVITRKLEISLYRDNLTKIQFGSSKFPHKSYITTVSNDFNLDESIDVLFVVAYDVTRSQVTVCLQG